MEQIIRTGFEAVTHAIQFNPQAIVKGQLLGVFHVRRVQETRKLNRTSVIESVVIRQCSVTLEPYKVSLEVSIE